MNAEAATPSTVTLDATDKLILNRMQDGMPISHSPYADVAHELGLAEDTLLHRLQAMLSAGYLSRVGPMYRVEGFGGGLELAAMAVPAERFEAVAELLNGIAEVAHNYERDHTLNMWFVFAAESPAAADAAVQQIESQTGLKVLRFPKLEEFYLDLRFRL